MRLKIAVMLSLISCTACGAREETPEFKSEELHDLTQTIMARAEKHGEKLPITGVKSVAFGNLKGKMAGLCQLGEIREDTTITIDREYWKTLSPCRKEMLLTHEWAHCGLRITKHSENIFDLMSPSLPNADGEACEQIIASFWISL